MGRKHGDREIGMTCNKEIQPQTLQLLYVYASSLAGYWDAPSSATLLLCQHVFYKNRSINGSETRLQICLLFFDAVTVLFRFPFCIQCSMEAKGQKLRL